MRGMRDTTAYLRRGIREIICLALFFFTFLACEYLFDVRTLIIIFIATASGLSATRCAES